MKKETGSLMSIIGSFVWYVSKIFRKTNISYPLIHTCTCVCGSGGKKYWFFRKFFVSTKLMFPNEKDNSLR